MLSDIKTIESCLTQWGRWAYIGRRLNLDFPGMANYERMRRPAGSGVSITDSEAELVDAVVSRLRDESQKAHDALALYYVCGFSYRQIGEKLGIHHRTASDLVQQGRMFCSGAMAGAPYAA